MTRARFVDLDAAAPDDAVVVIDVLRAFTTVPWALHRGVTRVLAVDTPQRARALRNRPELGEVVLAGEEGGRPLDGFDLGNSPSEVSRTDLTGRTLVHRTSAGTQGLWRCQDSPLLFAASFVTAGATARRLRAAGVGQVTYVVTGASLGRDGDEDLAAAELIAARVAGDDPDPRPFLARVPTSDAGRRFVDPQGPDWLPAVDVELACELDRFDLALLARPAADLAAIEVGAG
ncbi:2-phosphosulfolactate phosphatase [Egicoccus halophilus]|uniref:Probable 2-phosphosulfolactate phosphatase n=1 Tax=Egicoccus halophilus TaxID=1670830 RepID=A0A8J3EUQ3_9ACTN|nr:2-phosphosulfolactate phosphatase [Egicoccus halophilus]GGI06394.1 putative 2-phosphosulfolactate phosphatase [Egicoccus halophilus]